LDALKTSNILSPAPPPLIILIFSSNYFNKEEKDTIESLGLIFSLLHPISLREVFYVDDVDGYGDDIVIVVDKYDVVDYPVVILVDGYYDVVIFVDQYYVVDDTVVIVVG
jgi:hypothetical protein